MRDFAPAAVTAAAPTPASSADVTPAKKSKGDDWESEEEDSDIDDGAAPMAAQLGVQEPQDTPKKGDKKLTPEESVYQAELLER